MSICTVIFKFFIFVIKKNLIIFVAKENKKEKSYNSPQNTTFKLKGF